MAIFSNASSYALDTTLLDMRNRIFEQSKELKALLPKTKNVIFVNNMWDTCVLTMTQLEGYFFMLGIFNTIKAESMSEESIDYLGMWLNEIKRTNTLNIKGLNAITAPLESDAKAQVDKLKAYYNDLNTRIDSELKKLSLLKKTVLK